MMNLISETGKTICFKDDNKDELKIRISHAFYSSLYYHVYDTSEYIVKYKDEGVCGLKELCKSDTCKMGSKYPGFKEKKDTVQGFT